MIIFQKRATAFGGGHGERAGRREVGIDVTRRKPIALRLPRLNLEFDLPRVALPLSPTGALAVYDDVAFALFAG